MPAYTDPMKRFEARIKKDENGCWLWTSTICPTNGYATISIRCHQVWVHRWSYQQFKGEIPEGLVIDHLCRVRHCVNPDHLEAVPQKTNALRGISPAAKMAQQTHCKHGHPFDEANTYHRLDNGTRVCRGCANERQKKREHSPLPQRIKVLKQLLITESLTKRELLDLVYAPYKPSGAERMLFRDLKWLAKRGYQIKRPGKNKQGFCYSITGFEGTVE